MLDTSLVVGSAASAFNNAALAAPFFLWNAVLMLPLFALVWWYGNDALGRFKYTEWLTAAKNRLGNFALCIKCILFFWLIVMHGNFYALREATSNLPFVIAAVIFVLTASIVNDLKSMKFSAPTLSGFKYKRLTKILVVVAIVLVIGFSGMPTWWGFLMQVAAVLCGVRFGRKFKRDTTVIMFVLTVAILMQPEFFRFGQLGNLTALHMLIMLFVGGVATTIVTLQKINPRERIRHSAYVKLKWLVRFMIALCLILFALTESVPVFLGLMGVFAINCAMSIWYQKSVPDTRHLWAILVCAFGVMISVPLIVTFGILYWQTLPKFNIKQFRFLL